MKLLIPKNLKTLIKHNLKSCKREKEIKHEPWSITVTKGKV